MAWILIIFISQSSGLAATTAYFADEQSCRAALSWVSSHKGLWGNSTLNAADCFKTGKVN